MKPSKPRAQAAEAATAETVKSQAVVAMQPPQGGLLQRMASKYHLAPEIFERTVYAMAMPKDGATREELVGCLMVAHEHDLNPLVKEIYFMRTRDGRIQPIISVDGWITKAQRHPHFKGVTFKDIRTDKHELIAIECSLHRTDFAEPTRVTEYMAECKGSSPAWQKTPARMLRHRALTQAVRYGIGLSGVMDRDEFDQWQAAASGPSLPMPSGLTIDADSRPVEAEASQADPAEGAAEEAAEQTPDDILTALKAALDKAKTTKDLETAWAGFEIQVERKLPRDRQPEAFKLYDLAEARVAA